MATGKYYVGDVGTVVRVNTEVDLTSATVHNLYVKKPSGVTVEWAGTVAMETDEEMARRGGTTPLLSVITYTTVLADFSVRGRFLVQSYIETPDGKWRGDLAGFDVSVAFE